jgi:hypothetical protein
MYNQLIHILLNKSIQLQTESLISHYNIANNYTVVYFLYTQTKNPPEIFLTTILTSQEYLTIHLSKAKQKAKNICRKFGHKAIKTFQYLCQ